jgi:hypothetical protein
MERHGIEQQQPTMHPPMNPDADNQRTSFIPPVQELEHGPPPLPPGISAPNLTTYIYHVRKCGSIRESALRFRKNGVSLWRSDD